MYSSVVENLIKLSQENKKLSGRLTSKIQDNEKQKLFDEYGINDILTIIYCISKNIKVPNCLNCNEKLTLITPKKGFRKFCSLKCSCEFNNKLMNPIKGKNKEELTRLKYLPFLEKAKEYYLNNTNTIKEVANKFNLPLYTLRNYLTETNSIRKDIRTKKHEKEWKSQNTFLFDGTLKQLIDSGETTKTIAQKFDISSNAVAVYARKQGYEFNTNTSSYEIMIEEFLNELNVKYEKRSRKVIPPLELDFYLPEKNVAIEINGEYWHSTLHKEKNYHLNKQKMCEEKNIKLLQLFTHEFERIDCIKDIISSFIGNIKNKIYARKTKLKIIDNKQAQEFLEQNHLFGHSNCNFSVGLFYNEKLVCVATFRKPRFNKNYDLELIRFANKIGTQVLGGLGKIIKNIKQDKSIISYAHRRLFSGNCYEKVGFKLKEKTKPGYFWYSKKHGIISRYKTQKHKLKTNLTENQHMSYNGYIKIYDCGQNVYTIG
jgi:hypothetical protein